MKTSPLLGVNIDHAATLRQARYRDSDASCGAPVEPDPVFLALLAERAGADGITVHLREDRRHIQERDVSRLREAIMTRLNLEMACTDEMLTYALKVRPDSVCLVPENRREVTTEGGLDVVGQRERVGPIVKTLQSEGIHVSLFIDPEADQIQCSADLEAEWIELHTGAFANAYARHHFGAEWESLVGGAEEAHRLGLVVNAGHGINYQNITLVKTLPYLQELNIGHSILSRALHCGIEEAVREMKHKMVIQ